ncbi:MAG: hypothetical protein MSS83_05430 [Methanobrevibacter sp.]|uniref:hypothetical protein n=1 Tax=Methanobrevibacter sp. TaxID=66852 RepID=UPI0031F4ACCD|nr:hypothetical protein [Methanobrevibacter sp.]
MAKQHIELRKLQTSDIFPMSKIISKIGIKQIKNCFNTPEITKMIKNTDSKEDIVSQVGAMITLDIAGIILENLDKVDKDVYKFLSGLSGLSEEQISTQEPSVTAEMIIDLVKQKEFMNFFKVVSKLFK